MRSVRLSDEMEYQLKAVADLTGRPVSAVIREAVGEYCAAVLGRRLDRRIADVVGTVTSAGGRARESGQAFRRLLEERRGRADG